MQAIPESSARTPDAFAEVMDSAAPVIFRQLVSDWPVVQAARRSDEDFIEYMAQFDQGRPLLAMMIPPEANGRFFYNSTVDGFNFKQDRSRLNPVLGFLLKTRDRDDAPGMAIQSAPARDNLPGFEEAHPMPLHAAPVEPRVWVGNRITVAAHHDYNENIACCVAGTRRFTLFPPDQVANLYQGPFELTPAGTTISMVDFDNPDFEAHPRFRDALENAYTAELAPGDAIYIPYLWWHHVRSVGSINMLVNYWWPPAGQGAGQPIDSMIHAMLAIKDLSPAQRAAWKAMFENYVFRENGDPAAHLPEARRGMLGPQSPDEAKALKERLARKLSSP